ncbi:uncharacterized protein BX663DRAFT_276584 [Cokeromyces recurvatus]|uniref:uncharacterized protein n=1 Tax=Cokeromyces recurvatus TaxID=90255 RepID=UPI00221F9B05|nr:uncharacterized protein BX663DRAFT_276584 [Cokeromyces recurvatus]KAI7897860.1 hypothetical protein BX663DRAFT_276584 [Cokeromyces recurvatus]
MIEGGQDYRFLDNIWKDNYFTPYFREKYINALLVIILVLYFSSILIYQSILYYKNKKRNSKDALLYQQQQQSRNIQYGSIISNKIDNDDDDACSSTTAVSIDIANSSNPWSAYNWIRLSFSIIEVALVVYITCFSLSSPKNDISQIVEGNYYDMMLMYYTRIIFWTFNTLLSFINICLSFSNDKHVSDTICSYLNYIYGIDFAIQLINLYAYYQVYDIFDISIRYQNWMISTCFVFMLLLAVINESRYAPSKPIIAETGRILSGEKWASLYSKFMFSWVDPMLKQGQKKTLNENDLMELIAENRTKNTLASYRLQKKYKTMTLKLLATFKWPLITQFIYCIGWSILMFGPAYFLNKIIKFIENGGSNDHKETISSAYLYVLGLFITSSAQSLCYQQALYIGRSLGIRIQSIVIGEVYSKSLRRRDQSGSTTAGGSEISTTLNDSSNRKANVNNLLSVDAQKLGDLIAYIFYIYCFPIQVGICIWSLYRLLGFASFWGVLIIGLSQPLTFALSRRFQRLQHDAMSCTDKRISLMNELLSAIRIVKFFAWETEFRERILRARSAELKVIRARLMSFMWIGNVWFLIPVLIMVAVFYAYTREYVLTASTAFTALALFNNFKTALDELPVVISFILQANVSIHRIEKFLEEEEVKPATPFSSSSSSYLVSYNNNLTAATFVGFINNASFSWNSPTNNTSLDGTVVPHLKNLNISFPLNQLSIICGPTGSGKTTMLASLLGETYCLSGQAILPRKQSNNGNNGGGGAVSGIAYVAQTAWLQNCSIRDNILFGLPYDEERYEKVLYMTALTRDLDILEFGDATEVGEKGITLSGGQKQRVAIARAVYSQAEIVILDDCLSAVDAHTAKHLYQYCLLGEYMRNRTVILVTHHVGLCIRGAGYVVALDESGSVAAAGMPLDVIKSGVLSEELSEESWMENTDANEELVLEGPIPNVPTKVTSTKNKVEGGGKLVQDEIRAEGSVKWSVYGTYYYASGGFFFWISVLLLFCLAQASVLGQDYWIRVWSAAYDKMNNYVMDSLQVSKDGFLTTLMSYTTISTTTTIAAGSTSLRSGLLWDILHYFNKQPFLLQLSPMKTLVTAQEITDENPATSIHVGYYLGIYFLIGMLSLALTTVRSLVLFLGSIKASHRIHSQLLDRILRAKIRFFDTTPIGRIVNRFSSDLETIDQAVAPSLSFLLYSIVATVYVVFLISIITPAFIIPGIFIALMFKSIGAYYLKTSRDMKRLNSVSRSPIYVQFNETNIGIATIRAFGCQKRFIEENHKRIDANNRPFLWMWATNRWLHCRVDILGAFVGFCTGAVLISSRNWIDPGLAGLSLSYALTFTHHVLWIVRMYAMNEMNMNAIERIHEYLDIEEEPETHIEETAPHISWPERGIVKVDDLVMQYASDTPAVLRHVSFETKAREKIGIVGRTGSGKSTLAMSLFRFMEPTSGHIWIDGVDIHSIGLHDLRSRLTIIPQDPVLFSGTLRSNLDPFGQYDDATLWAALKRSHLIDHADSKDTSSHLEATTTITLDSPVTENGNNWSQGQRQLIALARALVKKTSLIILDEATSSVDFDTDYAIQETIRKEFVDSTLLCIAHRIRTVIDYDRILVLDQGRVMEFDTPYTLMTREGSIFKQMCERSGEYQELLQLAKAKYYNKSN